MYALGVTIYQLIHGSNPFKGNSKLDYWKNTMNDKISFDDICPLNWKICILKLMDVDVKRRLSAK
jgi:hypothetical protein